MKLQITQTKSRIGANQKQKATLDALGLRKNYQTVEQPNNACTQGMITIVKHLVKVEEVK